MFFDRDRIVVDREEVVVVHNWTLVVGNEVR